MTVKITIGSKTQKFMDWCADLGISPDTVYRRMKKHGVSRKEALLMEDQRTCKKSNLRGHTSVKKSVRYFELGDKSMTLSEWAKELGISKSTLLSRIYTHGWDIERALTTPVDKRISKGVHESYKRRVYPRCDLNVGRLWGSVYEDLNND